MKKSYLGKVVLLALVNFLARIAFFSLPIHHDEDAYFGGALAIYENNFNPFIEFWSYKPPFLFEITAVLFKLLGPSRVWGRLIIAFFSSLSLLFLYLLGEKIFNKKTGFWAAIILFFFPLFMAQSFLFHTAVPLTALTLAAFYFYFGDNRKWYFIFASLLVLTKEPMIFVTLLLSVFHFWRNYRRKKLTSLTKEIVVLIAPLSFFIAWMLLNKKFLGWFLWPYNLSYFGQNPPYARPRFVDVTNVVFKEHFLWFVFSLLIAGFVFSLSWKKLKKHFLGKETIFFSILFISHLLFFCLGAFLPRYLLFAYPLMFLCFVNLLEILFERREKLFKIFMVGICCCFFLTNFYNLLFYPKIPSWSGERFKFFPLCLSLQEGGQFCS